MKKLFLVLSMFAFIPGLQAQTFKYVVFTSTDSGDYGMHKNYQPLDSELNSCIYYHLVNNTTKNFGVMFVHENEKGKSNQPVIVTKPLSLLNTLTYDDLDTLQPMSIEQINAKYKEYSSYDKLYFIDRRDFTQTTLTIVEVLPISKVGARY